MATIKEFLEKHGGTSKVDCSGSPDSISYDYGDKEPTFGSWENGNLQGYCGTGEIIINFPKNHTGRWRYCIIRDDDAGRKWDSLAREGKQGHTPRPSAKLRLCAAG